MIKTTKEGNIIMDNNQLIRPELEDDLEENLETSIRPKLLEEYIGQSKVKENMKIYIEAAKKRGEPLGPCFIIWPPRSWKDYIS